MPIPIATEATPTFSAPAHWRAIDLLSDLHLAENTPRVFDAWAAHMLNTRADAVFILGDLFEVWIGDDMAERGFEARCVEVLKNRRGANDRGVPARQSRLSGRRRDARVGRSACASPIRPSSSPSARASSSRTATRSASTTSATSAIAPSCAGRPLQRAFGALPFGLRSAVGRALRRRSGRREPPPGGTFVDVDAEASVALLRAADAPTLVHGHTHAPRSHDLGPGLVRHVLSDWELDGSSRPRAEVVRWSERGFERIAPETAAAAASAATP